MIKCAVFDLDGTLADTCKDLGRATDYVLKQFKITPKWSDADYRAFVGNGARKLIERAFEHSLNEAQLDEAFEIFREKYNKILLDNACLYDGIRESLDYLKSRGVRLAVVTNKPHSSAVIMTEKLFGKGYFDFVAGAREDKPKKPDPYFTKIALEKMQCSPEKAFFFGDSDVDIMTAKNAGIDSAACSWGFRSRESLEQAAPTVILDSPKDIMKLFEKKC